MGVPKNKTSKANRRMNRAGRYADNAAPALSLCPQCHSFKQAHRACPVCGYYKGRPVTASDENADVVVNKPAETATKAKAKKAEAAKQVEAAPVETAPAAEEVVEEVVVEEAPATEEAPAAEEAVEATEEKKED